VQWLLTVYFALVHVAGREVANGASTASGAERSLLPTLLGAFGAPPPAQVSSEHLLEDQV
jgi:hypothetical protein